MRNALRWSSGFVAVALSLWFMSSQLSLNFARLGAKLAGIPGWALAAASALFALSVVAETLIWQRVLRTIPGEAGSLSPAEAFAVLNVTAIGKYIPGKVWGYAWQMYLLDRRGVPPRASLRTNAVAILGSCTAGALVGSAAAAFGHLGAAVTLASFAAGIGGLALVPLHEHLGVVDRLGKRLGIDLGYDRIDLLRWLGVVASYCGVWTIYCLGGVLLARVLEPGLGPSRAAAVFAAMCLSWLVGAVVVVAPAGLGVREAVMALALAGLPGTLGLVLPIATRLLLILVDLLLEVAALGIFWRRRGAPRGAVAGRLRE